MRKFHVNLHDETFEAIEATVQKEKDGGNKDANAGDIVRHALAEYYLRHHNKHLPVILAWGGDRRRARAG